MVQLCKHDPRQELKLNPVLGVLLRFLIPKLGIGTKKVKFYFFGLNGWEISTTAPEKMMGSGQRLESPSDE